MKKDGVIQAVKRFYSARRPQVLVAPSLLACDFRHLAAEVKKAEAAGADLFHLDVMDGHFVPNLTFGPLVVAAVRQVTDLPLDVHLMIANPHRYLHDFREAGADFITVHQEAVPHLHRVVAAAKELGARAGVALNPATPLSLLDAILAELDIVLLMSVNPGFSGQQFIPEVLRKVREARERKEARGHRYLIEIDGGMNGRTAPEAVAAGAEVIVAGNGVFGTRNYRRAIGSLRSHR